MACLWAWVHDHQEEVQGVQVAQPQSSAQKYHFLLVHDPFAFPYSGPMSWELEQTSSMSHGYVVVSIPHDH